MDSNVRAAVALSVRCAQICWCGPASGSILVAIFVASATNLPRRLAMVEIDVAASQQGSAPRKIRVDDGLRLRSGLGSLDLGNGRGKVVGAIGGSVHHGRWYAVHTLPHKEDVAAINLNRQGFFTFTPRTVKSVRHARQFRVKEQAYFPRYLFIALDVQRQMWRSVNGTIGVARLVTSGDRPVPLPEGIVERFVELSDERGIINFGPRLKIGDKVEMLSGPFASLIGRLESLDASGRVKVLLEILGGEVPVRTRVDVVLPVR